MSQVSLRHAALALGLSAFLVGAPAVAQTAGGQLPSAETRAELAERARVADSLGRHQEAFAIQARLRDGDFEVGDRMLVTYEGPGLTKADSLIVQEGRIVRLGEPLGDLSVAGVLRFEIQDLIKSRVDRYFKNEVVHVTPLTRIAITGAVRAPGVYHVRSDAPLADVLMRASGADGNADPEKIVIRRGQQVVWQAADVRNALSSGMTLASLHLEPGDEVFVPTKKNRNYWVMFGQAGITIATSLLLALIVRNR